MKTPTFDNWTSLFLLFSFLGIITSILLQFQGKQKRVGKILISILLLLFSITLIEYVLYWTKYQLYFPYLSNSSIPFYFTYGPLIYIYVNLESTKSINRKELIHFIPFIIAFLVCIPFYLYSSDLKSNLFLNGFPKKSSYPLILQSLSLLSIVHLFLYSYLIFKRRTVFNEFVLIKNWVTVLSIGLLGIAFSYLTYIFLSKLGILKLEWDYMISFAMSLFIILITIVSYIKPQIFNDLKPFFSKKNADEVLKYKNSPIDNSMSAELAIQLQKTMVANSLWRKNDLRLEDLAQKLELPKHYVSQVINEQFNMNFFEFVNNYRIEEAKTLIEQDTKSTLIEIAYQVGFNNKVSFGKAFKNNTNLSPLEFKKSIKQKSTA